MNNFDITDIETTLKGILREAGVSQTVYSNRPKATPSPKDDFVVVSVTGRVEDVSAYGRCRVLVYLFARDAQAFKNGAKLSVMYNAFRTGLPGFSGKYEFDQTPSVLGDVADDYGYHARVIELFVNIKSE
jgi:hypothetical protein